MEKAKSYKVNISFAGTASLVLDADTADEARALASELTVTDLARAGVVDILTLKVGAREVTAALPEDGTPDDNAPRKPRPSGWYRPA